MARTPALLDAGERLGRAELEALQLDRLQDTLLHAYENVPFYRAAFDAAGLGPDDCHSLADLARFPFTTKADLRANYPFGMLAVEQSELRRLHASSGTTGRPTVVGYTAEDIETWAGLMARSIRAELILEQIAKEADIKVDDDEIEMEIERLADQTGESARRVRAQMEREDLLETLAAQLIECRKEVARVERRDGGKLFVACPRPDHRRAVRPSVPAEAAPPPGPRPRCGGGRPRGSRRRSRP